MSLYALVELTVRSHSLYLPPLVPQTALRNPRLAHLRTSGSEDAIQRSQERKRAIDAQLAVVAEHIESLGYPADAFIPTSHWSRPDLEAWNVSCGNLSPSDRNLCLGLLSPQVSLRDSTWVEEYRSVLDAVVTKFKLEAVDSRSMHIAVQSIDYDQLKKVLKLFCLFEGQNAHTVLLLCTILTATIRRGAR